MKKPEWTIENVITSLENNSCSDCSTSCRTHIECTHNCFYKEAIATAVEYLKVLQMLNEQIEKIPAGYKFVVGRNWERGTDANS